MQPEAYSPILELPEQDWLCANALVFAIVDRFPVSPGHVLVISRRVVPTFVECTAAEQGALTALVSEVKALLDTRLVPKPDGYNVGFSAGAAAGQTVPHVHLHVIPGKGNYLAGTAATVAVNTRPSRTTGVDRPLRLRQAVPPACVNEIALLASFAQPSELDGIRAALVCVITAGTARFAVPRLVAAI
jgi:diadenosine tetraphosphate (Ap4A) HIT family hydrolase